MVCARVCACVCICVWYRHVYMHRWVVAHAYENAYMWRTEVNFVSSNVHQLICWGGGSLTEPTAHQVGKASWPASSEMPLSAHPQVFIGMHNHTQPFHLYWESELAFFCLHTRHFTHWGIYLTTSLLHSWFQPSVYCSQRLQISNKTSTSIGIWLHQTSKTIK